METNIRVIKKASCLLRVKNFKKAIHIRNLMLTFVID